MPDDQQSATQGPFSQYLQPQIQPTAPSTGHEGTGTAVASILQNFLAGASKTRADQFNRSEQQRNQQHQGLVDAMKTVQESGASDEVKAAQMAKLQAVGAKLLLDDHTLPGTKKGQQNGGDPDHPGNHFLNALRGMATKALGPGGQKLDPSELQATVGDAYKSIYDPNNSAKTVQQKAIEDADGKAQHVVQLWQQANKTDRIPTAEEQAADPHIAPVLAAIRTHVGETPYLASLAKAGEEAGKARTASDLKEKELEATRVNQRNKSADEYTQAQMVQAEMTKREQDTQAALDKREQATIAANKPLKDADVQLRKAQAAKAWAEVQKEKVLTKAAQDGGGSAIVTPERLQAIAGSKPNDKGQYEEALKGVSPGVASLVRQLADYKLPANTIALTRAGKDTDLGKAIELAPFYDPTFDPVQYGDRVKLRAAFKSGKEGQQARSLRTFVAHAGHLWDQTAELDNTHFEDVNKGLNWFKNKTDDPRAEGWQTTAGRMAEEGATAFKGGGSGTDIGVEGWQKRLNVNAGRDIQKGNIITAMQLVGGRIRELKEQYTQGMGKPPTDFNILSDESRRIITKIVGAKEAYKIEHGEYPPGTTPPPGSNKGKGGAPPAKTAAPAAGANPPAAQTPAPKYKTADDYMKAQAAKAAQPAQ